jgi:GGDEF domain-containing protein
MARINIPGVGLVDFPDSMSEAEIADAIDNDILKTSAPKEESSFIDKAGKFAGDTARKIGTTAMRKVVEAGDIGLGLLGGTTLVPDAAIGLADIASGGRAGKALEDAGYDSKQAREFLDSKQSDALKESNKAVADADGFVDTTIAAIKNPRAIVDTVAKSAPLMLGGGVVGAGVRAAGATPYIAGAVGEGLLGAGIAAEGTRQESKDGLLTGKQSALSLASGVGTALTGALGGKLAQKLGIADIDTVLAGGGVDQVNKSLTKRLVLGGLAEGVFEEMPQSAQEQVLSNIALDKPLMEGVSEAAAMGMLAGAATGGAASAVVTRKDASGANKDVLVVGDNSADDATAAKLQQQYEQQNAQQEADAALAGIGEAATVDDAIALATETIKTPLTPKSEAIDASELLEDANVSPTNDATGLAAIASGLVDNQPIGSAGDSVLQPIINADTGLDSNAEALTQGSGFGDVVREDNTVNGALNEIAPIETPEQVAGEKLDKEWTAFTPESGSLGIPRAEMPQIKAENRGAMTNFLNARGISHEQVEVPSNELKPTQLEFSQRKIEKAKLFKGGDRSILISSDNHVLDGHHQWMAKLSKGEPIDAIRLNAPIAELIDVVKEFPSATVGEGASKTNSGAMNDSWRAAFEKAKTDGDLPALDNLYGKVRIALNGVAQGKGEATVKQFETLKKDMELYAAELKGSKVKASSQSPSISSENVNSTQAAPVLDSVRPLVERLIKRRAAAAQSGMAKSFDSVVTAAKDLMEGKPVSPGKLKTQANLFKNKDKEISDILMQLHDQALNTPDAIANKENRSATAKNLANQRMKLNLESDGLMTAIAKLGGLNSAKAQSEFGIDPADMKQYGAGIARTFKSNGMDMDAMRELLLEQGYPVGETVADFGDALADAMNGIDVLTAEGQEALARKKFEEYSRIQSELSDNEQQLLDELIAEATEKYGADTVAEIDASIAAGMSGQPMVEIERALIKKLQGELNAQNSNGRNGQATESNAGENTESGNGQDDERGTQQESPTVKERRAQGENRVERRGDEVTRKNVADMSADEMRAALLVDDLTGIGNRRAYDESVKQAYQVSIDADGLKWINDNLGHESGDVLLAAIGEALGRVTKDSYHISGDEFVVQAGTEIAAADIMETVNELLAQATVEGVNSSGDKVTLKGIGISYGIAKDLKNAELKLQNHKSERETAGLRAGRGEQPANATITSQRSENNQDNSTNQTDLLGQDTSKQQAVADAERAKDAKRNTGADNQDTFTLTGSNSEADKAAANGAQDLFTAKESPKSKVDDYGEKLEGARKDMVRALAKEYSDDEIASLPLSKLWPITDINLIENKTAAAIAWVAREEIPSKPRKDYAIKRWVESVKRLRAIGYMVSVALNKDTSEAMNKFRNDPKFSHFHDKVSLLEAIDRDSWKRIGRVEAYPEAYKYNDGEKVPSPFVRVDIDGKSNQFRVSNVADVVENVNEKLGNAVEDKRLAFEVRGRAGAYFINKKGDKNYTKLKEFKDVKADNAFAFIKNNYDELLGLWEATKEKLNVKESDVRNKENRTRTGEDYRKGKDVSSEEFTKTFGFRGIQFGEWVKQGSKDNDRQGALNAAYDALMDLANIVGVPPKALSLEGSLGLAFGARGASKAAAHFEQNTLVINLTKTNGAGTLAHEWFHALDNYFSRKRGVKTFEDVKYSQNAYREAGFITYKPEQLYVNKSIPNGVAYTKADLKRIREKRSSNDYWNAENWIPDPKHPEGVRPEVEERFADLVNALNASPMKERARAIDGVKIGTDGYWSRIIERAARAFENYVINKMQLNGYDNDYLANVVKVESFNRDPSRFPYLYDDELTPVSEAFDNLFRTIKTKETDTGTALFSRTKSNAPLATQLQSIIDGDNPTKGKLLIIADNSPASLQMFGFDNLPVVTRTGADGVLKMHYEHGLNVSKLANVIENGLKRPAMILQHKGQGDVESLRFVTNEIHNGNPVILAIQPDKTNREGERQQLIATAFEVNAETISRAIANGDLLYRDTTAAMTDNVKKAVTRAQIKYAREPRIVLGIIPNTALTRRQAYKVLSQSDIVKFETNNADSFFSRNNAPTFYSALSRAIDGIQTKKAPAVMWKGMIKNLSQKGVKPDEIEWTGVNEWLDLQQGNVSKEQVQDYLNANGISITETINGEALFNAETYSPKDFDSMPTDLQDLVMQVDDGYIDEDGFVEEAEALGYKVNMDMSGSVTSITKGDEAYSPTKYKNYAVDGGKNYKELLLTLPYANSKPSYEQWKENQLFLDENNDVSRAKYDDQVGFYDKRGAYAKDQLYKSSHFDQANILAHVRFDERTDADGNKVLFINEIQSDWAQEGKKKGFNSNISEADAKKQYKEFSQSMFDKHGFDWLNKISVAEYEQEQRLNRLVEEAKGIKEKRGVQSAPFVTKTDAWVSLAMKRMMRYAAENGFDKVAIINGQQAADLYSLRKQVETVSAVDAGNGTWNISADSANGNTVMNEYALPTDKVADYLGKEVAETLLKSEPNQFGVRKLSGQQLEIGGTGMTVFYDSIVPKVAKDVLKKIGGNLDAISAQDKLSFEDFKK